MTVFFILFIGFAAFYDRIEWWPYWQKQWAFYLCLFFAMPVLFYYSADKKWDRLLGDLSLTVYLGHFLVIHFVKSYFELRPNALTIVSLLFVSILALIVYFVFQKPLEEVRKRNYEGGKTALGL